MFRVKPVQQLHEKSLTTTALELRAEGRVDLGR